MHGEISNKSNALAYLRGKQKKVREMAKTQGSFDDQLKRLKDAAGVDTDTGLTNLLGIKPSGVYNARGRGSIPHKWFVKISRRFNVSLEWLISGDEEMKPANASKAQESSASWQAPVLIGQPASDDPWKNTTWQEVPVIGLGNCGHNDWYSTGMSALRTSLPVDYPYRPDLFAVLAVGSSMQPEGIRQGYVLFCDPNASIEAGDAVYVAKKDGMASVKKFLKMDDKLHLQGWRESVKLGGQDPYFEELDMADVEQLACVVVVKRKG